MLIHYHPGRPVVARSHDKDHFNQQSAGDGAYQHKYDSLLSWNEVLPNPDREIQARLQSANYCQNYRRITSKALFNWYYLTAGKNPQVLYFKHLALLSPLHHNNEFTDFPKPPKLICSLAQGAVITDC